MSGINGIGIGSGHRRPDSDARTEFVLTQRPLDRILSFTGRTIDDVVNDPIARNQVFSFYKLQRFITRRGEIRELEQQWNALGT